MSYGLNVEMHKQVNRSFHMLVGARRDCNTIACRPAHGGGGSMSGCRLRVGWCCIDFSLPSDATDAASILVRRREMDRLLKAHCFLLDCSHCHHPLRLIVVSFHPVTRQLFAPPLRVYLFALLRLHGCHWLNLFFLFCNRRRLPNGSTPS